MFKLSLSVVDSVQGGDNEEAYKSANPVCIAELLKTFLQHLPDSVIPQNMYSRFVSAATGKPGTIIEQFGTINNMLTSALVNSTLY